MDETHGNIFPSKQITFIPDRDPRPPDPMDWTPTISGSLPPELLDIVIRHRLDMDYEEMLKQPASLNHPCQGLPTAGKMLPVDYHGSVRVFSLTSKHLLMLVRKIMQQHEEAALTELRRLRAIRRQLSKSDNKEKWAAVRLASLQEALSRASAALRN